MSYCGPRGIPYSIFMGRPVRDGDPQWTDEDIDLALEWSDYQAELCPGCGTHRADWRENPVAFVAGITICPGCAELESLQAQASKMGDDAPRGRHFYLRRPMPGEVG